MPKYIRQFPEGIFNEYKDKAVPWGPVGYVVYKRTYSRFDENLGRTEEWPETVRRCIQGLLDIGGQFTEDECFRLFDHVFNLRMSFSGRALWQLGTDNLERVGADSLNNCWAVNVNSPIDPFCFTFNQLMLGGGVGFNIQAENVYELPPVAHSPKIEHVETFDCDFIVPDNREGWVKLLGRVLKSFFFTGRDLRYCTKGIRSKGELIKTFGGKASGDRELIKGISQIVTILRSRRGRKLRPIDCLDIMNIIGSIVVSGNVRRSAQIALGDPHDLEYMSAKNWAQGNIPAWRGMSNNSVSANTLENIPESFWSGYNGDGEPYGLVNLDLCRRYGRLIDGEDYRPDPQIVGTNPCVTGDTKVMTVTGPKRIDQLTGDTLVYCQNSDGEVVVRKGRNPRITGRDVRILKVTLDNGESIRVTPNHKFMTRLHGFVRADELTPGTSMSVLNYYVPENCDPNSKCRGDRYTSLSWRSKGMTYEHTLVGEYLSPGHTGHVHHVDGNPLNNRPDNLEILEPEEHLSHHSKGESNPRFSGYTNADIFNHGVNLCESLGRRFSTSEWQVYAEEHGLPQNFSKYRTEVLGTVTGMSIRCAEKAGCSINLPHVGINNDVRIARTVARLESMGYATSVVSRQVHVERECESCGTIFTVPYARREQSYCSHRCVNKARDYSKAKESLNVHFERRKADIQRKQVDVFRVVKERLGRRPQKSEWVAECRAKGVSAEISRKSSPFRNYASLEHAAEVGLNHKVVKVEEAGTADVWNITVDEFHNVFWGGWDEGLTDKGRHKYVSLLSPNCGEIGLCDKEPCNLMEQFVSRIRDLEQFKDVGYLSYKVAKTVSAHPLSDPDSDEIVKRNHRLGIGATGIQQAVWWGPKHYDAVYRHIEQADEHYSKVLGINRSIKLTTVKPSGTLSLLPEFQGGCITPGTNDGYAPYHIRRIRFAADDPLVETCRESGYHIEPVKQLDGSQDHNTMVVSFPVRQVGAKQTSAIHQLKRHRMMQTYWSDNAVSTTVYYRREELPAIKDYLRRHLPKSIKSVSFLLHSEHGFAQAPLEEITKDTYDKMSEGCVPISQVDSAHELADSLECEGGHCPVK